MRSDFALRLRRALRQMRTASTWFQSVQPASRKTNRQSHQL